MLGIEETRRQRSLDWGWGGGTAGVPAGGRGLDREVGPMRTTTPRLPRAASPWPREPRGGGAVAAAI